MRWVAVIIIAAVFLFITGGAMLASAAGWGLPTQLDKPVSIREGSIGAPRHAGGRTFLYFDSRSHAGGGFHGGK